MQNLFIHGEMDVGAMLACYPDVIYPPYTTAILQNIQELISEIHMRSQDMIELALEYWVLIVYERQHVFKI